MSAVVEELLESVSAPLAPVEAPPEETPEEKAKRLEKTARKPPEDGECIRCHRKDIPINRKKFCYECWVETNLEAAGWRGGPHPASCQCVLPTHGGTAGGN